MFKRLLLVAAIMFSTNAGALSLQLVSHTGSYAGMLNTGLGLGLTHHRLDVLYGYTPLFYAGENLYTNTWRYSFYIPPGIGSSLRFYAGTGLIIAINDPDLYQKLPNRYPEGYYPPTGRYFAPHFGIEVGESFDDDFSFYAEFSILDYYAEMYYRSEQKIDIKDVMNYGFGTRMRIW